MADAIFKRRERQPSRAIYLEEQKSASESRGLEKFHPRDYKAGDIVAPKDMSPTQMKKWGKRQSPGTDAFDALNLKPLDMYKVCLLRLYCDAYHNTHRYDGL